jgi:hypothetical protein
VTRVDPNTNLIFMPTSRSNTRATTQNAQGAAPGGDAVESCRC